MKTSINLDKKLLDELDDYRAKIRPIPSKSDIITELLQSALTRGEEPITELPQEAKTALPKDSFKFEDLKIILRFREDKGGASQINLPYQKVKDLFKDKDTVDVIIIKKPKTSEAK